MRSQSAHLKGRPSEAEHALEWLFETKSGASTESETSHVAAESIYEWLATEDQGPRPDIATPFADKIYGPQLVRDDDRSNDLIQAIAGVKKTLSAKDRDRLDKVAFTIIKLGTGLDPVPYAGEKEEQMYFSASLLKLTLIFASFEMVARVNKLATHLLPGGKPEEFFRNLQLAFGDDIAVAIPWIPEGKWKTVKFDQVLTATRGMSGVYKVKLNETHRKHLETIVINQMQDWAARNCMHRLGYSYVNGALAAGGFLYDSTKGIWYGTDLGGGWEQVHVPVDTGGTSSAAMTTYEMARLLTAMHTGTLVDEQSSQEMMKIISRGGSWLSMTTNPKSVSFTAAGAKVGHHPSADAKVSSVKSEGVFLNRNGVPFVAVWQNYPDNKPDVVSDVIHVYRVIDEVLKKWSA